MTPADKLEALEAEIRFAVTLGEGLRQGDVATKYPREWADRLAAIRAELGEAVSVAELFVSERGMHAETRVPPGTFQHGRHLLYTTPPASVPVEALREVIVGLRTSADRLDAGFGPGDMILASAKRSCADELTAIIVAQEKP